jgi:hypothetical protein
LPRTSAFCCAFRWLIGAMTRMAPAMAMMPVAMTGF